MKNYTTITKSLNITNKCLVEFVYKCLHEAYGKKWWEIGVYNVLSLNRRRDLQMEGSDKKLKESLDLLLCLILIDFHWKNIFGKKLSKVCRTYVKETINIRNKWAHIGVIDFSDEETMRMLETISLLVHEIDPKNEIKEIHSIYRDSIYIKKIIIPIDEKMLKSILGHNSHPYIVKFEKNKIKISEIFFPNPVFMTLQAAYRGIRKVATDKPFNLNLTLEPVSVDGRIIKFKCNSSDMLNFFPKTNCLKYKGNVLELDFNFFEQIKLNKVGEILNYYFDDNRMVLEIGSTQK